MSVALVSAPVGGSSSSTVQGTNKVHLDREMGQQNESSVLSEWQSPLKTSEVVVRFYFVRHGETLVNTKGLVLGQTDSVRRHMLDDPTNGLIMCLQFPFFLL